MLPPTPPPQADWSVAGVVTEVGSCPGLGTHVSQSCLFCVRGSAGHTTPWSSHPRASAFHGPSLTSCVATGTCTHPRGGGPPPTWTPWDRPPVSPPTPIHLGTHMSPASATPARRVLMLTQGGWASLTPSAPDRRQPQPSRGWGGLDPRHHVPGTGRGHGV